MHLHCLQLPITVGRTVNDLLSITIASTIVSRVTTEATLRVLKDAIYYDVVSNGDTFMKTT